MLPLAECVLLLGLRVPGNNSFSLQCSLLACLLRADARVRTEPLTERDGEREREKEEMETEEGEVERDTAPAISAALAMLSPTITVVTVT